MKKLISSWSRLLQRAEVGAASVRLLLAATLWTMPYIGATATPPPGPSHLFNHLMEAVSDSESNLQNFTTTTTTAAADGVTSVPRTRRKRAISSRDMSVLLEYHNRVRSQVSPPAANMEYMVWDESLANTADSWASRCVWEHGPSPAMRYMGQNLSISSARYHSITDLVRSWHNEKQHFSYPNRCSGPVCSHYTQMVWASTRRMGCAVRQCANIYVFGSFWKEATLLVCNYAIKGNWVGEAPYRVGRPCSGCPSSYGGSCWRGQCLGKSQGRRH